MTKCIYSVKEGIMISWIEESVEYYDGTFRTVSGCLSESEILKRKSYTLAGQVLKMHHAGGEFKSELELKFDALASPDNNYVSILSTLNAVGTKQLSVPWILSNCHNSLCCVSGTQNGDDHSYGLAAAEKYGAIFIPPYQGVIHQYMREQVAAPLKMILGSDSHTRYGPLGTLGFGEGGGEIAKHILGYAYPLRLPKIVAVELNGSLKKGVGPMDVALTLIRGASYGSKLKDCILEFQGDGIKNLTMDMRMGIDIMTTEASAVSSIWAVDERVENYLEVHHRGDSYSDIFPMNHAYYDHMLSINLDDVVPMMSLPPHPSNAYPISYVIEHAEELFSALDDGEAVPGFRFMDRIKDGNVRISQGVITGCAGGSFENIASVCDILEGEPGRSEMRLQVSASSSAISYALMKSGTTEELLKKGIPLGLNICGGCFGVSDIPAHGELSARHVTRNFPMREGAKRNKNQACAVVLMDARSIAATYRNGGNLTSAQDVFFVEKKRDYVYEKMIHENHIMDFYGKGDPVKELPQAPGLAEWPIFSPMKKHLIVKVALSVSGSITTDDLIPSGEISALRSHPENLSQYTLINIDPDYARRAKMYLHELSEIKIPEEMSGNEISFGTVIAADIIGDGSSREQAASSQRILGGIGNIAKGYATQRYKRNLINYGILPLQIDSPEVFKGGEILVFEEITSRLRKDRYSLSAYEIRTGRVYDFTLPELTDTELDLIFQGGLINYEKKRLLLKSSE